MSATKRYTNGQTIAYCLNPTVSEPVLSYNSERFSSHISFHLRMDIQFMY